MINLANEWHHPALLCLDAILVILVLVIAFWIVCGILDWWIFRE